MNKTLTRVVILIALATCTAGCWQTKFVTADQCVLVDLKNEDGQKLVPDLDAFAQAHGMTPNKTAAMMFTYELQSNGHKAALITYSIGVSEHGAELGLFNFGEPRDAKLNAAFEEFVDRNIKPRYGVKRCADVPDYAPMKASD